MRPTLRWLLAISIALAAIALWQPDQAPKIIGASERGAHPIYVRLAMPATPSSPAAGPPLPRALPAWSVEAALRDPFTAAEAAVAGAETYKARPVPPAAAEPMIAPPAPTVVVGAPSWRFFGRMSRPDGIEVTLLTRGGHEAVAVQAGTALDDGFVVMALAPEAVRIVHAATGTSFDVALPPALASP